MDSNAPLLIGSELSQTHFDSNHKFLKQRNIYDDNAFFRMNKFKAKYGDKGMNSDGLSAFLSAQDGETLGITSVEKLTAEELSYSDLASLTEFDLELMGFKYSSERENLLKYFSQLPNQDPTFEELCSQSEAETYNALILNNATKHLNSMQHALVGANYKLHIAAPDDVLVGDKYFASRFVVEALEELNAASQEIEHELNELLKDFDYTKKNKTKRSLTPIKWILFTTASSLSAIGLAAYWFIKTTH